MKVQKSVIVKKLLEQKFLGRETQYVLAKSMRKIFFSIQCGQAVMSEI